MKLTLHAHVSSHPTHHRVHTTSHGVHAHPAHRIHTRHAHHIACAHITSTTTAHPTRTTTHTTHHATTVIETVVLHAAHRATLEATHHARSRASTALETTHGGEVVAVVEVVHASTIVVATSATEPAAHVVHAEVHVAAGRVKATRAVALLAHGGIFGECAEWVCVGICVVDHMLAAWTEVFDLVLCGSRSLGGGKFHESLPNNLISNSQVRLSSKALTLCFFH